MTALRRPAVLSAEILERALEPAAAGTASETVADLVAMAGGRRPPLEAAASLLIARLHRRSDDFSATTALGSVTEALNRIGWEMPSASTRTGWKSRF